MSQRDSGYERKDRDCYETPEWVTEALLPHLPRKPKAIWEPAAANLNMVQVLLRACPFVYWSDINGGCDFLKVHRSPQNEDAIITNPPYHLATQFIEHALGLTREVGGFVAMLLRTDFDHAKTRRNLFSNCGAFAKKLALTKRIVWFEPAKASPSFNHAWFIWDWKHSGPPTLAYGP